MRESLRGRDADGRDQPGPARRAGLVLFDEPSQGLAPKVAQDVMATVSRLKGAGISALVVEQNAATALQVSDRAYVMDRGRIVHEGPAADLLADDELRVGLLGV